MEDTRKTEEAREPLKSTTVLIALDVQHHGGVSDIDLSMRAQRWLQQNQTDLSDRIGGQIIRTSVTTRNERNVAIGGSGSESTTS